MLGIKNLKSNVQNQKFEVKSSKLKFELKVQNQKFKAKIWN